MVSDVINNSLVETSLSGVFQPFLDSRFKVHVDEAVLLSRVHAAHIIGHVTFFKIRVDEADDARAFRQGSGTICSRCSELHDGVLHHRQATVGFINDEEHRFALRHPIWRAELGNNCAISEFLLVRKTGYIAGICCMGRMPNDHLVEAKSLAEAVLSPFSLTAAMRTTKHDALVSRENFSHVSDFCKRCHNVGFLFVECD